MESLRPLSKNERDTLEALIVERSYLRPQLQHASVAGECDSCGDGDYCPSIRLTVDRSRAEAWGGDGPVVSGIGWVVPPGPPPPDKPGSGSVVFYKVWLKDGWLDSLDVSHFEDSLPDLPPAWTVEPDYP